MVLGFLALTACSGPNPTAMVDVEEGPVETLYVDVAARVVDPGAPAAWVARAAWARPSRPPSPSPGVCRRPLDQPPQGRPGAEAIVLEGVTDVPLDWVEAQGGWSALGPRQVLDPAWSVADVAWVDAGGHRHVADDAVRFGGLPDVTRVVRDREGGVSLAWDPATVGATELRVSGPAGAMVCGTGPEGATLPWWVVPAYGGEVVLESVREGSALVDGVLVRVRTTLERVIRLDEPAGTTAEEKLPAFRPYSPHAPRRLVRPAKSPVG